MADMYYVDATGISASRLRSLQIRIYGAGKVGSARCLVVAKTGLEKIEDARYRTTIEKTTTNGVYFVTLKNPDGTDASREVDPRKMFVCRTQGNGAPTDKKHVEWIQQLAMRMICPLTKRDVVLHFSDGMIVPLPNNDAYTIVFGASPTAGRVDHPPTIFGVPRPTGCGERTNCGMWVDGNPLYSSAENYEAGSYTDKVLYIYPTIHKDPGANGKKLVEIIFTEFARVFGSGSSVPRDVVKSMYMTACSSRAQQTKAQIENEYQNADKLVAETSKKLVDMLRTKDDAQRRLRSYSSSKEELDKKLALEFDSLCTLPKVTGVSFRGERFAVRTECLFFINPETKKEHELGRMQLVLNANDSTLSFFNLDRKVHGMHEGMNGPHLFEAGNACLGNMANVIPQLVGGYEWSAAVQIAIAFCESVNFDDGAGRLCGRWPLSARQKALDEGKIKSFSEWPDPNVNPFETKKEEKKVEEVPGAPAKAEAAKEEAVEPEIDESEIEVVGETRLPDFESEQDRADREARARIPGSRVILARHATIENGRVSNESPTVGRAEDDGYYPASNWIAAMERFVGLECTIADILDGTDERNCLVVSLVDDQGKPVMDGENAVYWRLRNCRFRSSQATVEAAAPQGVQGAQGGQAVEVVQAAGTGGATGFAPEVAQGVAVPLEFQPEYRGDNWENERLARVGMRVIVQRHHGGDYWEDDEMNRYIGATGTIATLVDDIADDPSLRARLTIDGETSEHEFRVRNMRLCMNDVRGTQRLAYDWDGEGEFEEAEERDEPLPFQTDRDIPGNELRTPIEGVEVRLARHMPVNGEEGWTGEMDGYVGMRATVTQLAGRDPANCMVAMLNIDGRDLPFLWRVRNMQFRA